MKHVKDFFDTHPGCDEVHEALGYLFTGIDDAEKMLAGVDGQEVKTYSRADFETAPVVDVKPDAGEADKEMHEAFKQEEEEVKKEEEIPPVIHNDATTYGKSAEEVESLQKEQKKNQKAVKESADKAKAKSKPKGK